MLDVVYYPISALLWLWHRVFGAFLGADNGFAWALSVVFLVFTVRAVLLWPGLVSARAGRRLERMRPELDKLRRKHGKDPQKLALETQKLQREHGVRPLLGCLPALAQIPVFFGLYHVLRSFNRTGTGLGQLGLTPDQNANTANYVFSATDVQSFLSARLFGAPISVSISSSDTVLASFAQFGGIPSLTTIAAVAIPLMAIACLATHINARFSVRHQAIDPTSAMQSDLMRTLMLWVMPLGSIISGPILPIAILLYWVANNVWTYGQQQLVHFVLEREERTPVSSRSS
ncbi:Membrane protein insertase YidC OS=Tsukamurella paurometabola (strain ATCC 8368 / DSM / CCUG 35730 / CIP 100753 / JCM 10117 / KCTC 9821 / NBRC 16120 / NCIMB 702349 / NCTC 13040) OX=521096 GN=Tpau_1908 PE=3 SV=1 [Tsukamurella paurometabola]|uniref:Membrane protein insertase YidC n=1 Tax=Tsukamurella paurometabola (strain ATCC 8368 / DSM 20162 / CCUG 35730 / CIP 100753 / JCM 10117 / KCTC 9821 / NBRC 16120 / NCIMB 702349 / NCTC 13040) TaxID=521096 RepID=D5UN24_TSUPD|nr:membrane protein insertase YidC [Tsukamurella paurometabola]ADG78521.1 membrane protein insertase, YidC/Oxa1 family [Tsukamurella paurometabola DSM 20162]SUP32020.1 Membrane protein YidC 1 [Tsukamurella paurometabola]